MKCHPHPDPQHVISAYRGHILACKRRFGSARSLIHYRQIMKIYCAAKRERDAAVAPAVREIGAVEFQRFIEVCRNAPEPTEKLRALLAPKESL